MILSTQPISLAETRFNKWH